MNDFFSRPATPAQKAVVEFIATYRAKHGYAPTLRELACTLGVSIAAVRERLDGLERKGLIHRTEGTARSLVIPPHKNAGLREATK